MDRIATVSWAIWNERNSVAHGADKKNPAEILSDADSFLRAYKEARLRIKSDVHHCGRQCDLTRWRAPDSGLIKINTDGANIREGGVGMGVVIRDHHGEVVRVACKQTDRKMGCEYYWS